MNNSRCNPIKHSLDTKRGKSFNFVGKLTEGAYYFNDNFVQDFVSYQGALLACKRSHQCKSENLPKLIITEENLIIDIETNLYWEFVCAGPYISLSNITKILYEEPNIVIIHHFDGTITKINLSERQNGIFIHVGTDEPTDSGALWVDPNDDIDPTETTEYDKVKKEINQLTKRITKLETLQTAVVPGDANNNWRSELVNTEDPVNPETGEEDTETEKPPLSVFENPTTKHVCVKHDIAANFVKENLIDGELIFYTDRKKFAVYYGGQFYVLTSSESEGNIGLTESDLYNLNLQHLTFTDGTNSYRAKVNSEGRWVVGRYNSDITLVGQKDPTWYVFVNPLLCINSVFCGKSNTNNCLVSHNYIELANGSNTDINLNGLVLLYTDGTKTNSGLAYIWHKLDLEGVIPAGKTFTIRGKRCQTDKRSFIKVDSYDMEWRTAGDLIEFGQGCAGFYLGVKSDHLQTLLDNDSLAKPWTNNNNTIIDGYIDSCGFGVDSPGENSSLLVSNGTIVNENWDSILFTRWFAFEPAKQGNKAYKSRSTDALWTYIDLNVHTSYFDNNTQYYYSDLMKSKFGPKASFDNKNFFTNKTLFTESKPNILNITFGIQATDNGQGATRCFNWVSVGYYDEYIEYKNVNENQWHKIYSISEEDFVGNSPKFNSKFKQFYNRIRWATSDGIWVTTHKCIIHGLVAGEYEYRVGRKDDSTYQSDILSFTVKSDEDVSNFTFIQTSDQQGFNWQEYTVWMRSSEYISKNENNFDFTINTGDIAQSGNRVNEWLDYYEGRKFLRNKEEMYTIGNNDLCGVDTTELGNGEDYTSKYNHINVLYYYTFELDEQNTYEFDWIKNETIIGTFPIYSLYSFNYGAYHFICFNSEVASASSKMYSDSENGDDSFASCLYKHVEEWLLKDLQIWNGDLENVPENCAKCIVYCHEMPFTMVTYGWLIDNESGRGGSKSNVLNSNGKYRYSRLFKKFGIRLVIGGHKHTFTISKPIYDAKDNYLANNLPVNELIDNLDNNTITDSESRRPIIQVTSLPEQQTDYARYEIVDKFDAPTYVMCQATGYKLVSNKEQPSEEAIRIPWLLSYFPQPQGTGTGTNENVEQHKPTYIRYTLTESEIKIQSIQINNIWNVKDNTAKFDFNNQITALNSQHITLSHVLESDIEMYAPNNINEEGEIDYTYYTIYL